MIYRIAFLFGLLFAAPAFAADNATLITPCASGCVTMRSKDIGAGVQSMIQILGDTSGNAIYGTAGTANANVLSVQGIASGTALPVSAASLPLPTGAATSALQTTGNTALTTINTTLGTPFQAGGSIGNTAFIANAGTNLNTSALATSANLTSGTQKTQIVDGSGNVIASTSNALNVSVTNANANGQAIAANSSPVVAPVLTVAGAAVVKGGVPVVNGGSRYQAVAASATATVLQSSTGATGDYLSHCVIFPATTSPGVVTVFDGSNTAANSSILFAGGATSVSNLAPIPVPVGALSRNGGWAVTTGTNVSVACYGSFS